MTTTIDAPSFPSVHPSWRFADALRDLADGLAQWELWSTLGYQDIRQRYRRSTLGPFWLTISMAVMVGALGFLYSNLFKTQVDTYLPYLCLGVLFWNFISQMVTDGCIGLTTYENLIKQIRLPVSIHIFRIIWRNIIILAHNFVVYIAVALIFSVWPGWVGLLVIPGLVIVTLNGVWLALLLGMLTARFRDVGQLVMSFLQVVFFISPVMWRAETLPEDKQAFASLNPVSHLLAVTRDPLLGIDPSWVNWSVAIGITVVGWIVTFMFLARFRNRVAYWL